MVKRLGNEDGFTLLELLVFLSVLAVLLLLTVPFHSKSLQLLKEQLFVEQLHQDVLFLQNQSAYHGVSPSLRFYEDHYLILKGAYPLVEKRNYPPDWKLLSPQWTFRFSETGTLLNPRTITMVSEDERIDFVFPLGKGGFYVEKEEWLYRD